MKVSVVIIFKEYRKKKLFRLLNTLKSQLTINTEVILIHESRNSIEINSLPIKVRYVKVKENQGIPYNRNQGIKNSKGDVIVYIDDDCWVPKNWLYSILEPLKDKKVLAVTSGTHVPKSNLIGDSIAALGFPGGGTLGFSNVWKVKAGLTNHLAVGNCALRKTLFDKVGLFDESLKLGAEDAELSHRMEKFGILIVYAPKAYAFHEARSTLRSFIKWQIRRGNANYHFKKKVGDVSGFVKLRLWSTTNILKHNIFNWRLPLIISLLGLSFILQQIGYYQAKNGR
ncbi:MAG: glycosyltransferase family 2 protein [Nanoarchaeota archaeon]|nr:glycosyltransferase family 2 protein [Nanoarchaeota archaeon]